MGTPEQIEKGRLTQLQEVAKRFKLAIDAMCDPAKSRCTSDGSDWKRICNCAMLGSVHRELHSKVWYGSGVEDWVEKTTLSVRHLVQRLKEVRTTAVDNSGVVKRKGGIHHTKCSPWDSFTIQDIVNAKGWTAVEVDEDHFKKQQAKSGVIITGQAPVFLPSTT